MSVNPNNFDPRSIVTNADTKFCTLPGQEPITLSTEHGGHGCRISDIPRTVPLFFHQEAISKGAYTEEQIAELTSRLSGASLVSSEPQPPTPTLQDSNDDGFEPAPAPPTPPSQPELNVNSDRAEQIKAAVIDLMNNGNPADFTSGGSPKVEALKDKLGFEVTGPERDTAFDAAKG